MRYTAINEMSTVLYYTPQRYAEYDIGTRHKHFGNWIEILGRHTRSDLGSYFEITYRYV